VAGLEGITYIPHKILVYGDAKTGKSHFCLDVINWLKSKGYSPDQVAVAIIDADDGIIPLLKKGVIPREYLPSIKYKMVTTFKEVVDATTDAVKYLCGSDIHPEAKWVIVDNMARCWELTQRQFSVDVYGKDYIELLKQRKIEALVKQKSGQPTFDRLHDFAIINPMHNDWFDLIRFSQLNFIITAPRERQYDKQGNDITDSVMPVPRGNKDNVYKVDTMVFKKRGEKGEFLNDIIGTRLLNAPFPQNIVGSFCEVMKVLENSTTEVKKDESKGNDDIFG